MIYNLMFIYQMGNNMKYKYENIPRTSTMQKYKRSGQKADLMKVVLPWLGLGIFNKMDITHSGLL